MNIQEINNELNKCLDTLNENNIDDDSKLDLDLLALHLKRQLRLAILDPLKDLDNVTVADLSQLSSLVTQVKNEIDNENKRTELLKKAIGLAKIGLKAAGLPIPS